MLFTTISPKLRYFFSIKGGHRENFEREYTMKVELLKPHIEQKRSVLYTMSYKDSDTETT
jgi:hypothetical protein